MPPYKVAAPRQLLTFLVRFTSAEEAARAVRARNGGFIKNARVSLRVLPERESATGWPLLPALAWPGAPGASQRTYSIRAGEPAAFRPGTQHAPAWSTLPQQRRTRRRPHRHPLAHPGARQL